MIAAILSILPDDYYQLDRYSQSLIILGIGILLGFVIRFLSLQALRVTSNRFKDVFITSVYNRIKGSWFLFIPLIFFLIFFPRDRFDGDALHIIEKITETCIIISFAVFVIRLVNVIEDVVVNKYDITKADNVRERKIRTQLSFVKRVLIVVIVTISVSLILLSIDAVKQYGTALITSAGVAGIVIGFAAQKTIANLLAGFQIAFTQPIKIDDAVVIEGEWGWIDEINLTYVVVRIWDWRRLIVPITYFIETPFQNWTRTTADLLGSVFLYVDYTVPLEKLREAFDDILEKSTLWDQKAKVLQVTESTEKSMQIRLLMSARNSPQAWDLRCEVREKMIQYIQQHYPESFPRFRAEFSGVEALRHPSATP